MHKIRHIILLVLIIQFSIIAIAFIDFKLKYKTKSLIAITNNYKTKSQSSNTIPKYLLEYPTEDLIWNTFNNPINSPIINKCLLHIDTINILNKLKSEINFRVVNCYVSNKDQSYILSNLNTEFIHNEYGKLKDIRSYLSINRESGKIVDIEILDKHNNKLYRNNKYLNTSSSSLYTLSYMKRVTNYPWMWKID